jgi:hypothetical protein
VHRPADLLVEERVRGEAVDLVVEPERDLAEPARALVEIEQRVQEVSPAPGLGRSRIPSTSRPWKSAGNEKLISPSVSASSGLV